MRKSLTALALSTLVTCSHATAQFAQVVDWDPSGQTGTLGSTTVQLIAGDYYGLASPQPEYWSGPSVAVTFGAPYFAGPVSLDEGVLVSIPARLGASYVFQFSQPVQDVRLSLGSFASRANVYNERGQHFVRESGQQTFFVFCSDFSIPCIYGQPSNAGTPNDSNGTVLIPGLSTRVSVDFTSILIVPDQVALQISATPLATAVPEPAAWALTLAGGLAVWLRRQAGARGGA